MNNLLKAAFVSAALICTLTQAHSQENTLPATQYEEQVAYPSANSDAMVIVPGRDLMNDAMPSGPQTELNFPEPSGEVYEENTTVVYPEE